MNRFAMVQLLVELLVNSSLVPVLAKASQESLLRYGAAPSRDEETNRKKNLSMTIIILSIIDHMMIIEINRIHVAIHSKYQIVFLSVNRLQNI